MICPKEANHKFQWYKNQRQAKQGHEPKENGGGKLIHTQTPFKKISWKT